MPEIGNIKQGFNRKAVITKRSIINNDIKTSNHINVDKSGDINIIREIKLNEKDAFEYFQNNLFIKFSFECIKAITNIDNVGLQILFSILKKNVVRPTIENNKNEMNYLITGTRADIMDLMYETGFSERHIRSGIKSLIDNNILLYRRDIIGNIVKGHYILNINFINNLNFQQWYNNVKCINNEYHVNITYKIIVTK